MKKTYRFVRHIYYILVCLGLRVSDPLSANPIFVQDAMGPTLCDLSATISVDSPNPGVLCPGESITLTVNTLSGVDPITYLWFTGETEQSITIAAPYTGDLGVIVSSADGCVAIAEIHLEINVWQVDIDLSFNGPSCLGDTIELTATSTVDIPGTTYLWSTGETTQDIHVSSSGSYEVTMTNPSIPCLAADTVVVNILPIPEPDPQIIAPALLCPGQTATLTVNGGPFNVYTWGNGSNLSTLDISDPGTYSIHVENAAGCSGQDTIDILQGNIASPILSGPSSLCTGQIGTIDITNAIDYTSFEWNTGSTIASTIANLPGTYFVTVTEVGGCTATSNFTIDPGFPNMNIAGSTTPLTSCIHTNGSINIMVTPVANYSFLWSNGQSTEDINSLAAGQYSVTVTDVGGCTATNFFNVITDIFLPDITADISSSTCDHDNGAIDLSVSPAGSYTFLWTNSDIVEDLFNIPSGTYTVTVTSTDNGCTSESTVIVPNIDLNMAISSNVMPVTSCSSSDGAIDVTISPAGAYSFIWSDGSLTEDITGLTGGNYTITVSAGGNCIETKSFFIPDNTSVPLLSSTIVDASCGQTNGSIDMSLSPPGIYIYQWSNGSITEDLSGINGGTYSLTVTSGDGCSNIASIILPDHQIPLTLSGTTLPNTSCNVGNGSIDISLDPLEMYSYEWSTGDTLEDLLNINSGSYSVTATLGLTCIISGTFVVADNITPITISGNATSNTSCNQPNGSIDINLAGPGTFSFLWSGGETTEDIYQLTGGTYTVTVTDDLSCTSTGVFDITNSTNAVSISATIAPALCGGANGSIDVTLIPSTGNTFLWSNGDATEDLQNLTSGSYIITVTDSNGCQTSDTIIVPDLTKLISLSALQTANTNCIQPNGSIDLSVAPAGGYTFSWTNGETTEDLVNLGPGTYTVTVMDSNGCTSTTSYFVQDSVIMPAFSESISPSSCGQSNGLIDLTIIPLGNYLVNWSTGDVSEDLQNILSGTYTVTVTGENGCTASAMMVVRDTTNTFSVSTMTTDNTSCTSVNGSFDLTVTPAGSYQFLWSDGAITEDVQGLQAGTYTVTVTDASLCSNTEVFNIANSIIDLVVDETLTPALCGETNGRIDLNVMPSIGNTFLWSNGRTTEDQEDILPGWYSVTVTGQNGCSWSASYTITGSELPEIEIASKTVSGNSEFLILEVQISVPWSALDTLIWFPENLFSCEHDFCNEQTIMKPLQPTEIFVMVIDTNGCIAEARLQLEYEEDSGVFIPNMFSPNGDGINDVFTLYGNKYIEEVVELSIFDRWGNMVFHNTHFPPNVENYGWDGRNRNADIHPDVFVYLAKVKFTDGSERIYKRDVTIVR